MLKSLLGIKMTPAIVIALVVGAITSVGVAGTYAEFTAQSANPGNTFSAATIALSTDHPSNSIFSATNMVPGDSITRTVEVQNSGTADFTYTITASDENAPSNALWTDLTNGLQITAADGSTQLYSGPISQLTQVSTGVTLGPGAAQTLTFTVSLPTSADNSLQGLSDSILITLKATQLPGSSS